MYMNIIIETNKENRSVVWSSPSSSMQWQTFLTELGHCKHGIRINPFKPKHWNCQRTIKCPKCCSCVNGLTYIVYVLCELRKHTLTTITGEQHLHSNTCNGESATTQRTRNGLCLLLSLPLNGVHTGVTAANCGYACVRVCVVYVWKYMQGVSCGH